MANFLPARPPLPKAPHEGIFHSPHRSQKLRDECEEFYWPSCYHAQENFVRTFCAITEKNQTSFSESSMLNLTENINQKCRPALTWPAISSFQACWGEPP